jgi:hypothetical protein
MQLAEQAKAPARLQMERERRRLGQVRKSFAAVIEQTNAGASPPLEFMCACVDYIRASLDRLHAQDQRIHDLLAPHAGTAPDGPAVLANLNHRLAASRDALDELTRGAEKFRASGGKDWGSFGATIARFMDVYLNTLLKGHHSTMSMQEKVMGLDEWNHVAGVSNQALVVEAGLFALVKRLAPAGADPDSMAGGPPGGPPRAA